MAKREEGYQLQAFQRIGVPARKKISGFKDTTLDAPVNETGAFGSDTSRLKKVGLVHLRCALSQLGWNHGDPVPLFAFTRLGRGVLFCSRVDFRFEQMVGIRIV